MAQTVKLILGNIIFHHFEPSELDNFKNPEAENKALIHEVCGILECESVEQATELGEDLCNIFQAYIIPSEFKGEIAFEKGCKTELIV